MKKGQVSEMVYKAELDVVWMFHHTSSISFSHTGKNNGKNLYLSPQF